MSILKTESMKVFAESIGITNISEDVLQTLAQDVEYRIRDIAQTAQKFMIHGKREKLSIDDVNNALESRQVQPVYGYIASEQLQFRKLPKSEVFYVNDEVVDFETILNIPLPKVPLAPSYSVHWLAIEGIQPEIPQNPAPREIADQTTAKKDIFQNTQEYMEIRQPIKHVLSKELQVYYEKIITFLDSTDTSQLALDSIQNDAGIQQLVPYFIQHVTETLLKNLAHLETVQKMINLLDALLSNQHLFIEPYLHQIMPSLLSCILAKRLSQAPTEPHWQVRQQSGSLAAKICKQYANSYQTLVPRVTKTLEKALIDFHKPNTTRFGAIVTLSAMGPRLIEMILVPHMDSVWTEICNQEDNEHAKEAFKQAIADLKSHLEEVGTLDSDIYAKISEFQQ